MVVQPAISAAATPSVTLVEIDAELAAIAGEKAGILKPGACKT